MIVKLLTEHHLEFLSLKGGCRGSSEYTHVKMPHLEISCRGSIITMNSRPSIFQQTPRKKSEKSTGPPYPYKTYVATLYRAGVFRSPRYNNINFNYDLVISILCQQANVWDQVFK